MSGHTPGPWRAALDHNNRPIVWGPGTWQIADCWHTPDGNGWSNARLIAAAPDLLGALLDVMGWIPGGTFWHSDAPKAAMDRARAAIAKATGAGE